MKMALSTALALCLLLACSACKTEDPAGKADTSAAAARARKQAAAAFDALEKDLEKADEAGTGDDGDGARLLTVSGKKLSDEEKAALGKAPRGVAKPAKNAKPDAAKPDAARPAPKGE